MRAGRNRGRGPHATRGSTGPKFGTQGQTVEMGGRTSEIRARIALVRKGKAGQTRRTCGPKPMCRVLHGNRVMRQGFKLQQRLQVAVGEGFGATRFARVTIAWKLSRPR